MQGLTIGMIEEATGGMLHLSFQNEDGSFVDPEDEVTVDLFS